VYPWKGVCKLARLSILRQLTNYDDFIRLGRGHRAWDIGLHGVLC
jgi:hypothetical protein